MNRKYVIAIGVCVLVVFSVFLVGVGVVVAQSGSEVADNRPEHITCTYNETKLNKHQPFLQTGHLDNKPTAMYGAYCTSPEYSTDVAVYFVYYPVQEGVSSADSHQYDREPVYVFVNESGQTACIRYSAYHYIKGTDCNPSLVNGNNPQLRVVQKYHHYVSQSGYGRDVELGNFSAVHQLWYNNGWEANPEVTGNPWAIKYHSSWWDEDNKLDYKATNWYWSLELKIKKLIGEPTTDL